MHRNRYTVGLGNNIYRESRELAPAETPHNQVYVWVDVQQEFEINHFNPSKLNGLNMADFQRFYVELKAIENFGIKQFLKSFDFCRN